MRLSYRPGDPPLCWRSRHSQALDGFVPDGSATHSPKTVPISRAMGLEPIDFGELAGKSEGSSTISEIVTRGMDTPAYCWIHRHSSGALPCAEDPARSPRAVGRGQLTAGGRRARAGRVVSAPRAAGAGRLAGVGAIGVRAPVRSSTARRPRTTCRQAGRARREGRAPKMTTRTLRKP